MRARGHLPGPRAAPRRAWGSSVPRGTSRSAGPASRVPLSHPLARPFWPASARAPGGQHLAPPERPGHAKLGSDPPRECPFAREPHLVTSFRASVARIPPLLSGGSALGVLSISRDCARCSLSSRLSEGLSSFFHSLALPPTVPRAPYSPALLGPLSLPSPPGALLPGTLSS